MQLLADHIGIDLISYGPWDPMLDFMLDPQNRFKTQAHIDSGVVLAECILRPLATAVDKVPTAVLCYCSVKYQAVTAVHPIRDARLARSAHTESSPFRGF